MANKKIKEAVNWQGNKGSEQAKLTDHTLEEAETYIKTNYPFYKKYTLPRAEPGWRALEKPEYLTKGVNQADSIDDVIEKLGVAPNPMMTGSVEYSPSRGDSWHTFEGSSNGIGILYFEHRGMRTGDWLLLASKTKENLAGVVKMFRDAGVLPDLEQAKQTRKEKAASRLEKLSSTEFKPGDVFGLSMGEWQGVTPYAYWKIIKITPSGKVHAERIDSEAYQGEVRAFHPRTITKKALDVGREYLKNKDEAQGLKEQEELNTILRIAGVLKGKLDG